VIAGGAVLGERLYTWGSAGLDAWDLPGPKRQRVAAGDFRAGCVFAGGLALEEGAQLVWRHGDRQQRIDTEAAAADLAEARLFGRRGLLVSHRGMQIRFYEPGPPGGRWPYREIYSFYTASEQGGLLVRDIDGDGREDIVCGNYWIQSPAEFGLPWRLFAINLFHEHPLAAAARLAWWNGALLWLESKRAPARAVLFRPGEDVRELWGAEPIRFDPPLAFPRAVLPRGGEIWIGEDNGAASRILAFPSLRLIRQAAPVRALVEWRGRAVAISPTGPVIL
jgi:hypothetical protein